MTEYDTLAFSIISEDDKILFPTSKRLKTDFLALVLVILLVFSLLTLYFNKVLFFSIKYECGIKSFRTLPKKV